MKTSKCTTGQRSIPVTTTRVMVGGAWFVLWFSMLGATLSLHAQESSTGRAIVTASPKSTEDVTTIPRQTISVFANRKLQDVSAWVPLRGERSGLQLVLLLDDSSRGNLGLQLNDLKSFLAGLPTTTQVAVGYMRNGSPNLVQNFTTDHAQAAKALRLPSGIAGGNGSPYFCLSALVKQWPGGDLPSNIGVRREVVMVTDGVDRYSGARFDPDNPYVQAATRDAQKAGVIIYSIYYRGAGRFDQNSQATDGGQNYLVQISGATGGKAYLEGFGNPVSFSPFLSDIQRKLQNQYELTFSSAAKPGMQDIRIKTSQPNTTLAWPSRVQVGAVAAAR